MITYNFAAGPGIVNPYTTTTTFSGLQASPAAGTGAGYTFLNPAGQPNTALLPHPQLRVSDNGNLAVEAADLTQRQPRYFFANPASIAEWNKALTRLGSFFQLIPEPAATVTFSLGGAPRTLVRIQVANLEIGGSGDQLTVTENCDATIQDVTAPAGLLLPVLGQQIFLGTNITQQSTFFEYFIAISLTGGYAANTDLPAAGGPGLDAIRNAIGNQYGSAIRQLANGNPVVANPNLANDLQALGVNQYARPVRLGQGLRTASLGARYNPPGGGQSLDDQANNRVLHHAADINQVAWGYHWGGVIAIDGTDYLTLENYARAAETPAAVAAAAAPNQVKLFFFQMYGAGPGQSWHEQWEPPGAGKGFANGLTTVVEAAQAAGMHYYAANAKNAHADVMAAANLGDLQTALLKGLNYANMHLYAPALTDRIADKTRLGLWRQGVAQLLANPPAFAAGPRITALAQHVSASLGQVTASPV